MPFNGRFCVSLEFRMSNKEFGVSLWTEISMSILAIIDGKWSHPISRFQAGRVNISMEFPHCVTNKGNILQQICQSQETIFHLNALS